MSTIIKPNGAAGEDQAVRCAAFNFDDLAEKGNRYLAEVRRQAEAILSQAKEEAARLRQQAAEQGRTEAAKAAQQQAAAKAQKDLEARLQTVLPALTSAIAEIQQDKAAWRAHWERNAVQLAIAIAARVARREAANSPQVSLSLIREALELAAGAARISLHLNPADHQALGDNVPRLISQFAKTAQAEVVSDPDITPGGCRVVTELGEIDQQIESQLARIEEELTS